MYPFEDRRTWWIGNRFKHTLAIGERARLTGRRKEVLRDRLEGLDRWLKIRLGVFILLAIGSIVTIVSLIADALQAADAGPATEAVEGLEGLLQWVARIAGSLSGVLAGIWFLINRILGQYESDIVGLLIGAPGTNPE